MGQARLIKNKIRLIYASPYLYLMMLLQISFQIIYIYAYRITAAMDYFNLLKKDLFLWIICIPIMVVQHKVSVYSTYYNCVARIGSKRRMILADYITLMASTCISTGIVLSAPLVLFFIRAIVSKGTAPADGETLVTFFFLLTRYILLGVLIQYIIYSILYAFPNLQKRGGSICALPFVLYFVFTSPMELLRIKGQYLPALDFSAGGRYAFAEDGAVLWGSVFLYNVHLMGYLAIHIWITMVCLSKRWEFLENESTCNI